MTPAQIEAPAWFRQDCYDIVAKAAGPADEAQMRIMLRKLLADRFGRVRVLQMTVLWFSAFTFLSGFTHSFGQLLFTRAMQGFGFGGEWAVGSVLVSETIEARHRGKAAGVVQSSWSVGWAAAAFAFWGASVLLPPELGWRVLFWVGILPALLVM